MWGHTFNLPSLQSRQHHAVWFVSEPVCMLTPHEALGFHQQQPFVAVKIPPPLQNEPFSASWHPEAAAPIVWPKPQGIFGPGVTLMS